MLVNYTSDKKLLDLLATSDYFFGSSHVGESISKYLNLKGLGRVFGAIQKTRVEQAYELLLSMFLFETALKD